MSKRKFSKIWDDMVNNQLDQDMWVSQPSLVMPDSIYEKFKALMAEGKVKVSAGPFHASVEPLPNGGIADWPLYEPSFTPPPIYGKWKQEYESSYDRTTPYNMKYQTIDLPILYATVYDMIYRHNRDGRDDISHYTILRNLGFQYPENAVESALKDMEQANILNYYSADDGRRWVFTKDLYAVT